MKRDRDEIVIASIINELNKPRPRRPGDRLSVAVMLAGPHPEASRRILPRLEAAYGRRLVRQAWRRWKRWWQEDHDALVRWQEQAWTWHKERCRDGGPLLSDGAPVSDEERAASIEYFAAIRRASRWLPLDAGDPLNAHDPLNIGDDE